MSHNPTTKIDETSAPIKVAVISDDPLLCTALSSMLDQDDALVVAPVAEADVALCDLGAEVGRVEAKLAQWSSLDGPVLALLPDPSQAQLVLNAGARGVMLRDQVGPQLVSALRAVRGGLTVLDASLAASLVGMPAPSNDHLEARDHFEELTAREDEVLQLMVEGLSNKQIARRLTISEHTAKFHIGRILDKLDAGTRTEAVVSALRFGLAAL